MTTLGKARKAAVAPAGNLSPLLSYCPPAVRAGTTRTTVISTITPTRSPQPVRAAIPSYSIAPKGGFRWSSQHLDDEELGWDDHLNPPSVPSSVRRSVPSPNQRSLSWLAWNFRLTRSGAR